MKHVILFALLILLIGSLKAQKLVQSDIPHYEPIMVYVEEDVKWYKITKNDVLVMGMQTISGAADAINQAIIFRKFGYDKPFWDYRTSWQRKYRDWPNDKREAFPGSGTIFIAFTDGYHATRFVGRWTQFVCIAISAGELAQYDKKDRWKVIAKKVALSFIANRTSFTIIYRSL